MNPVIENIFERRSVRFFVSKVIPQDDLKEIIDAGNAAPSGMNTQGWRFVVVTDEENRKRLKDITVPKYRSWLKKTPPDLQVMRAGIDKLVDDPVYYSAPAVIFVIGSGMVKDMDCPMVCQNMMLAARSLGIGSCWVHMGQLALGEAEVNALLELKDGEKVFGPIVFGYPSGNEFPLSPPKKPASVKWA